MISEEQRKRIIEVGFACVGQKHPDSYKCHDFMRDIYGEVGASLDFNDFPQLSSKEIWEISSVAFPLFLHRKETPSSKRITHMGIIFPENKLLHCSRWMRTEKIYEVFLSPFSEVFHIYDFVESDQKPMV